LFIHLFGVAVTKVWRLIISKQKQANAKQNRFQILLRVLSNETITFKLFRM